MMIKFIKHMCFIVLLVVSFVFGRFFYIKNVFDAIDLPMPVEKVQNKMGKPDEVLKDTNSIEWIYYQFPFPEAYGLIIEDGMAVKKYHSISP